MVLGSITVLAIPLVTHSKWHLVIGLRSLQKVGRDWCVSSFPHDTIAFGLRDSTNACSRSYAPPLGYMVEVVFVKRGVGPSVPAGVVFKSLAQIQQGLNRCSVYVVVKSFVDLVLLQ